MSLQPRLLAVALGIALSMASVATSAAPQAQEGAPLAEPSKSLYWQGHEALGQKDWRGALEHFRELEKQLAKSTTEPADAAIYWQAYALTQAGRHREAAADIDRLHSTYPESEWLDDAQALAPRGDGEARDAGRNAGDGDDADADALMALDALMVGGSTKAVPLLQRVLGGSHSDKVKGRAMFVLSQIDPAAAETALETIIRGTASPKLKAEAIRMIAAGGRPSSLDRLLPLYRGTDDKGVRRGVLDAFLIGDRADLMQQVAESETDGKQRRDAIEKLGVMGEHARLQKMYASRTDVEDRRAILQSLGVAGDSAALAQLAASEADPRLKAEAIRSIGIAGGEAATAALVGMYRPGQPVQVRDAVIEGLMIADATRELITIYRKETDPGVRRNLLSRIAATDPDGALELIDETLKP
jgi:hypothetical protein